MLYMQGSRVYAFKWNFFRIIFRKVFVVVVVVVVVAAVVETFLLAKKIKKKTKSGKNLKRTKTNKVSHGKYIFSTL